MAGMIHGTRLEVGADAKKTIEILNKEFESTPCMKIKSWGQVFNLNPSIFKVRRSWLAIFKS